MATLFDLNGGYVFTGDVVDTSGTYTVPAGRVFLGIANSTGLGSANNYQVTAAAFSGDGQIRVFAIVQAGGTVIGNRIFGVLFGPVDINAL